MCMTSMTPQTVVCKLELLTPKFKDDENFKRVLIDNMNMDIAYGPKHGSINRGPILWVDIEETHNGERISDIDFNSERPEELAFGRVIEMIRYWMEQEYNAKPFIDYTILLEV